MSVEQIKELKVRIFDLNESLQERREFEASFFTAMADLLELPEEARSNPSNYIQAVTALKERVTPVADSEIDEVEIAE